MTIGTYRMAAHAAPVLCSEGRRRAAARRTRSPEPRCRSRNIHSPSPRTGRGSNTQRVTETSTESAGSGSRRGPAGGGTPAESQSWPVAAIASLVPGSPPPGSVPPVEVPTPGRAHAPVIAIKARSGTQIRSRVIGAPRGRLTDQTRPAVTWFRWIVSRHGSPQGSAGDRRARGYHHHPREGLLPAHGSHQAGPRSLLPGLRRRGVAGRAGAADGDEAVRQRRRWRGVLPETGTGEPPALDRDGRAEIPVRTQRARDRCPGVGRLRPAGQPRLCGNASPPRPDGGPGAHGPAP